MANTNRAPRAIAALTTLTATLALATGLATTAPAAAQAYYGNGCVSFAPNGWWDPGHFAVPTVVHGHTAYGIHYTGAYTTAC